MSCSVSCSGILQTVSAVTYCPTPFMQGEGVVYCFKAGSGYMTTITFYNIFSIRVLIGHPVDYSTLT